MENNDMFNLFQPKRFVLSSVADPDPGSSAFLPQGSGIWDDFFPGSQILSMYQILDFSFKNGEKQEKYNFV
jgi:hypothetical protein